MTTNKAWIAAVTLSLGVGLGAGCDPYDAYCGRVEQCANDDEDGFDEVDPDDDYRGVCAAQLRANERVLRANDEEECQVMADAYRLYTACLANLDCNDLNDEVRQADKCENERDDYDDAVDDADGDCQTAGFGNCSTMGTNTAPLLLAFVMLGLLARRRRR